MTPIAAGIFSLTGGRFALPDLVHEGMYGLFLAVRNYDPRLGPFEPHARVCIRRTILDHTRKDLIRDHQRTDAHGNRLPSRARAIQMGSPKWTYERVDPAPLADVVMITREQKARVKAAITKLPPTERKVIVMKLRGFTQDETGRRLGVHQTTARAWELRAIEKLKVALAS